MNALTKKEEQVYNYVKSFIETDGYAPSVRDICHGLGIQSTSTIHHILHSLEAKGCIALADGKSRAIRLTDSGLSMGTETIRVPLLSKVSDEGATASTTNVDGYVDFPKVMAKGKNNLFALRVTGNGLASEGILNGDLVIIESGKYLNEGDYVATLYEDHVYLLHIVLKGGAITLVSDEWKEGIPSDKCTVLGRLIADFRFF